MDKGRRVKRIAAATVMLLSAAVMQVLMALPLVTVDLPLNKAFDISFVGAHTLADHLRSLVGGVEAIEHGAFWATAAVCALEVCIVMTAVSGVKSLRSDDRSTWSIGLFGGAVAVVISIMAAYVVFDTVYPYGMINGATEMTATAWLMPCVALAAVMAAVVGRKGTKSE